MEILNELKLANCLTDQQVEEEIKIAKFLQGEHEAEGYYKCSSKNLNNLLFELEKLIFFYVQLTGYQTS